MTRIALGLLVWAVCDSGPAPEPTKPAPAAKAVAAEPMEPTKAVEHTQPVESAKAVEAKPVESTPPLAFEEHLGGLKLGMTLPELQAIRPSLIGDGAAVSFPPDGGPIDAVAGWMREVKDRESSVTLTSPTRDGVFRATTIWIESGTTATTKKGIALGAKRSAVKKAYPKARALVEDELYAKISDHEQVWFGFEGTKVSRMMLGPPTDPDDIEE